MWNYKEKVVNRENSARYYNVFKELVRKDKAPVILYGIQRTEQRYKNFFSKDGHSYAYSGVNNKSVGWPPELQELAEVAVSIIPLRKEPDIKDGINPLEFNSAIVNYYPDGTHYIGAHRDRDAMEGYIVSFSFGATRKFVIRTNDKKIVETIALENGSAVVMMPGMQPSYVHEIAKDPKITAGRINVTLRSHAT